MDSLKQGLKEGLSFQQVDTICLNPNPDSCSGMISSSFETANLPTLDQTHEFKISDKFRESGKQICEKCIWGKKSAQPV